MIDPTKFILDLIRWEGQFPWLYRDVFGYATIGIGNLVHDADEATDLPFRNLTENRPATADEIRHEFTRVMSCQRGQRASAYRATRPPRIELSEGTIAQMVVKRLEREFLPGIRQMMPNFDSFPEPAQACLVDMAYNLGIGRPSTHDRKATGLHAFGKLIVACNRGDWAEAARHCHVSTSREERNAWRAEKLLAARAEADRPIQ